MRLLPALLVLLVLAPLLSGCLRGDPSDQKPAQNGEDPAATDAGTTPTTGTATMDPTTEPDPSRNPTRSPSPPQEQAKDDAEEVERPGDYALLPYREDRRTDVRLDVPTWSQDDAWVYDTRITGAPPCTPPPGSTRTDHRYTESLEGRSTRLGAESYQLQRVVRDCTGTIVSDNEYHHLTDHLVRLEDDGYVAWTLLFPLEDGKRWLWQDADGHERTSETTYLPDHLWSGRNAPAWEVVTVRDDERLEQTRIFGPDAANLLYAEDRVDGAPFVITRLVSYERSP